MPNGTVDVFRSRRTEPIECEYWIAKDEIQPTLDEYDIDTLPDGTFFASEMNSMMEEYQVVEQSFMFKSRNVTLKTNDDISDITENSKVKYDDEIWRVKNVQKEKKKKRSYFDTEPEYTYYLTLRR